MGKLEAFDVVITNSRAVCQAGDVLQGYIIVHLLEDMEMKGIHITFKGEGYVSFQDHDYYHAGELKMYSTSEQYFKETYSLYSPEDGSDVIMLENGQHKFDFEYRLLPDLPSSFEGEYGYVRFSIKCNIHKPWKHDHTTKAAFTVLSKLNLNTTSGAQKLRVDLFYKLPEYFCVTLYPGCYEAKYANTICGSFRDIHVQKGIVHDFQVTLSKIFHGCVLTSIPQQEQEPIFGNDIVTDAFCCYCDQGAIFADLRLERRGHVPGEAIQIHARIRNSTQYLVKCQVQLCQIISFHASGKAKECKKVVNSIKHELTDIDETDLWNGDKLLIPPVPPSELLGCNIIDIKYYVLLKAAAEDMPGIEATIPLDILIGTVPLKSVVEAHQHQRLHIPEIENGTPVSVCEQYHSTDVVDVVKAEEPIIKPTEARSPSIFDDQSHLSPPSYETGLFGRVNIRDEDDTDFTRGAMEYAPMYAFYDWGRNEVQNSCRKRDKDDINFV